jgi:hypothetical protein
VAGRQTTQDLRGELLHSLTAIIRMINHNYPGNTNKDVRAQKIAAVQAVEDVAKCMLDNMGNLIGGAGAATLRTLRENGERGHDQEYVRRQDTNCSIYLFNYLLITQNPIARHVRDVLGVHGVRTRPARLSASAPQPAPPVPVTNPPRAPSSCSTPRSELCALLGPLPAPVLRAVVKPARRRKACAPRARAAPPTTAEQAACSYNACRRQACAPSSSVRAACNTGDNGNPAPVDCEQRW